MRMPTDAAALRIKVRPQTCRPLPAIIYRLSSTFGFPRHSRPRRGQAHASRFEGEQCHMRGKRRWFISRQCFLRCRHEKKWRKVGRHYRSPNHERTHIRRQLCISQQPSSRLYARSGPRQVKLASRLDAALCHDHHKCWYQKAGLLQAFLYYPCYARYHAARHSSS